MAKRRSTVRFRKGLTLLQKQAIAVITRIGRGSQSGCASAAGSDVDKQMSRVRARVLSDMLRLVGERR